MKLFNRLIPILLLLSVCLAAGGCTQGNRPEETSAEESAFGVTEGNPTEAVTEAFLPALTVDASWRIVISAHADEVIRKTADMVAATIREKVGLTLTVVTDTEPSQGGEIVLGATNRADTNGEMGWAAFLGENAIHIDSGDSITLYYAAEAVLEAWLTPDFGLAEAEVATLPLHRINELNGLTTRRDHAIKILSQNLRCADDPNGNAVGDRMPRFRQLVMEYQPDLIGTQETTAGWNSRLKSLSNYLNRYTDLGEYGMVGCSREGREAKDGEWNTILYRKDRFELLDSDTTWLSDTPDEASAVEGALCKRICTWALLKDKLSGETILFANTHLDHSNDEVRSAQMDILMDYLSDRIGQYPFYVTGDFNCYVDSIPYNTATSKLADSHKTAWTDQSTVTRTYHGYQESGGGEIDFIFHNDKTTPVYYEIISKDYKGFVSDHYGVIAEFVND